MTTKRNKLHSLLQYEICNASPSYHFNNKLTLQINILIIHIFGEIWIQYHSAGQITIKYFNVGLIAIDVFAG